jgi:hypothetical protein
MLHDASELMIDILSQHYGHWEITTQGSNALFHMNVLVKKLAMCLLAP